jgi:hypothetical protein
MFQQNQPSNLAQAMQYAMIQRLTQDRSEQSAMKMASLVMGGEALEQMKSTAVPTIEKLVGQAAALAATGRPEDVLLSEAITRLAKTYADVSASLMQKVDQNA